MRLVLATANRDKEAEMVEILGPLGIEVETRPSHLPDVAETEDTFVGNARLKAAAIVAATGKAALADDSGLEVDALDGSPGVRSARFAGEQATYAENRRKLLDQLQGVADRRARFRCTVVVLHPDGREVVVDGTVEGTIGEDERGDGGFGYDCVFVPVEGDGRTFAEMTPEEKHDLSHRGRALRALQEILTRGAR